MTVDQRAELMPVLVSHVAEPELREFLLGVALSGGKAHLPLDDPPGDDSLHVLEIHFPGDPSPLVVLAEPTGRPTAKGFPLRLRLPETEGELVPVRKITRDTRDLKARGGKETADLELVADRIITQP